MRVWKSRLAQTLLIMSSVGSLGTRDLHAATNIYRSVGPGNTTPLAVGSANALTIAGTTATFAAALPVNVGVGDVIQYDSNNSGTVNAVAFIHARTSATVYTVASASGVGPDATTASDTDWALFRAYTSLFDAERGAENGGINAGLRNFDAWSGGRDLVANNEVWNIAAYADATDTTNVVIDGWTTGVTNYLRIFTPNSSTQVGASQRHAGVWNASRYVFAPPGGPIALSIVDEYVRLEGLQVLVRDNSTGLDITFGTLGTAEIHLSQSIIRSAGNRGRGVDFDEFAQFRIWNNIVYGFSNPMTVGTSYGFRLFNGFYRFYNNTMVGNQRGVRLGDATDNSFRNNIAVGSVEMDFAAEGFFNPAKSSNNVSSDATAPGTSSKTGLTPAFVNAAGFDYHLASSDTVAADSGMDLSSDPDLPFSLDVDGGLRQTPWDIGADDIFATTAVELVSFEAAGEDGAVVLTWETASELENLGFHLYRSTSESGPYERITARAIPGLGSSPVGAKYTYRDAGREPGLTYYYELEDIETTGRTERHGPVSATALRPTSSRGDDPAPDTSDPDRDPTESLITYGNPEGNSLRVLKKSRRQVVLELSTAGFTAEPREDGTVHLEVPGFETLAESAGPGVPVKRTWVEAVAGHAVKLVSVEARDVETFSSLRPSDADVLEIVASGNGTVRLRQGRGGRARRARRRGPKEFRGAGLSPSSAARLVSVGFQGEEKKALLELAPFRWDESEGRLLLARRLVVRLSFVGKERDELSTDGLRGRARPRKRDGRRRTVVARLGTIEKGLYRVRFEDAMQSRRGVPAKRLRLSRQGETVAYHLAFAEASERRARVFGPGTVLYFVSEGAQANPYGGEAVYELEVGRSLEDSRVMARVSAAPSGASQTIARRRVEWEKDRYYQAALVDAPDRWLWDVLFAPQTKSYPMEVTALAPSASDTSKLSVWLQGASDFPASPDHHVRITVNGALVADESWDGKRAKRLDAELGPGLLRPAGNVLEIDNVGDTQAAHSMVMLDRFALEYPGLAETGDGRLEARFRRSGTAVLSGLAPGAHVLDVSEAPPRWLVDTEVGTDGVLRFHAEADRSYLAVSPDAVLRPVVTKPERSRLKSRRHRADYLVIGPERFLRAATSLLELRQSEGLNVEAVPVEEIYSEFGFGETTPEAIKNFLSYAYHHWKRPSPRYVLLLGDGTFDFKDHLQTGVRNQVPPLMVRTSYLWTASDPSYAAVNGDDLLPDLAIGRLPAATLDEVRAMVDKIVAYETGDAGLHRGAVVLVTDNPDRAGNFEADAEALATGVLASKHPRRIFLRRLGAAATRSAILRSFDEGASLVSYLGHGAIHLWADENFFNSNDVPSLAPQSQQPLLVTMNCLNGYFHFPYFDSLAEELLKARDKGAIAAFSPTGLSLNTPANLYHQALLQELFHRRHDRLGDAVLAAQKAYADTGAFPELLTIYHLFGDPALRLK